VPFSKKYKNNRPEFHVIGSKMLTPNGFVDVPKLTGPELKKEIGDDIPF
jgi:hypothetical protein